MMPAQQKKPPRIPRNCPPPMAAHDAEPGHVAAPAAPSVLNSRRCPLLSFWSFCPTESLSAEVRDAVSRLPASLRAKLDDLAGSLRSSK